MGILIFFGTALLIFITGVIVVSVTVYHWIKVAQQKKMQQKETAGSAGSQTPPQA